MMKFTKTEKLLLFAFGCSDRAETFCRLGAASGAVQCEPFTEKCEVLRKKLQVHQETEAGYREAFYKMRMELEPYLYGGVEVLKDRFHEPEEDGALRSAIMIASARSLRWERASCSRTSWMTSGIFIPSTPPSSES